MQFNRVFAITECRNIFAININIVPFAEAQDIPPAGRAAKAEGSAGGTGVGAEVRVN